MTATPIQDFLKDLVAKIGRYNVPENALDCTTGDLGLAYERGWNAALDEVEGASRKQAEVKLCPSCKVVPREL